LVIKLSKTYSVVSAVWQVEIFLGKLEDILWVWDG